MVQMESPPAWWAGARSWTTKVTATTRSTATEVRRRDVVVASDRCPKIVTAPVWPDREGSVGHMESPVRGPLDRPARARVRRAVVRIPHRKAVDHAGLVRWNAGTEPPSAPPLELHEQRAVATPAVPRP